ncbi:class F sortase [Actinoplanes sp. NPDC049596]|uniref:class F sortase n=1 Tax=unclassified Actinoplanes TaxID=2626549 RepID=UPI00341FCBDF
MISSRAWAGAAAVLLAVGGVAALVVGHREQPAAEPPVTVAAPESGPGPSGATGPVSTDAGRALTRGELLPTSPPVRVAIPALHADTPVAGLGLEPDGSMQVPSDARTVGWYTKAPTPGSLGPAILAGHVDFHGKDGTFARLATLRPGDQVRVTRADGAVAVFAITRVDRYPKDRFPADAVYGPIDHAGLRLITCGGAFDSGAGHYEDNVVAYADLRAVAGRE